MSDLNFSNRSFLEKQREFLAKIESLQENFAKKKKRIIADLKEANEIWRKVGEKFKWWQSLP